MLEPDVKKVCDIANAKLAVWHWFMQLYSRCVVNRTEIVMRA